MPVEVYILTYYVSTLSPSNPYLQERSPTGFSLLGLPDFARNSQLTAAEEEAEDRRHFDDSVLFVLAVGIAYAIIVSTFFMHASYLYPCMYLLTPILRV